MQFPKLTPLQSRMVASLSASLILLALYFVLSSPQFAYASELESIQPEDHNHERLPVPYITDEVEDLELRDDMYEPRFFGVDRAIIGRQEPQSQEIPPNVGREINVTPGETQYFLFTNASLHANRTGPSQALPSSSIPLRRLENGTLIKELRSGEDSEDDVQHVEARQAPASQVQLWITANTCLQPEYNASVASPDPPAQLILYVSTSAGNKSPGPGKSNQIQQPFVNGFANYTLNATTDVYFSVSAPNSTATTGVYSVQVAGSIDSPYHSYMFNNNTPTPNLHLIDSDTTSALLVTDNLTSSYDLSDPAYNAWMGINPPPFDIFVFNQNNSAIKGLTNSYCALSKLSSAIGLPVQKSMTNITEGNLPKEQFYVRGLNGSSQYLGILAMGNSTQSAGGAAIGGGGTVWQSMSFDTQSDGACSVIYNLTFCSSVAYSVPGNSATFPNSSNLATWYDNQASTAYSFFTNVLAQIPCEIESTSKYSLAKGCDDCAAAYKSWLCSITIPRCMDYTSSAVFLQSRNLAQPFPNGTSLPANIIDDAKDKLFLNSSRNPNIDAVIKPGPYKEILPCADLCYDLVRSCPASMGFACPTPGMIGFENSYGTKDDPGNGGLITCNFPGAVYGVSGVGKLSPLSWGLGFTIGVVLFIQS